MPRIVALGESDHRAQVVLLAIAVIVLAGAEAHAPKIESHSSEFGALKCSSNSIHHLVVHRPAIEWMRMADDGYPPALTPRVFYYSLERSLRPVNEAISRQPRHLAPDSSLNWNDSIYH